MMKKRIFLLLLIFCLGLGGCGKKEEQTKKKTTTTEETGIASKDAMLTLSMRIPETLNPLLNREETVDRILKLLFLPLLDFDESGQGMPCRGAELGIFGGWQKPFHESEQQYQMAGWNGTDGR